MSASAGASPPAGAGPGAAAFGPGPRSSSSSSVDLVSALRAYVDRVLDAVPGMKALVLDAETCRAVSLVYSQHELMAKDVFLTDFLHKQPTRAAQPPKQFLKAIVLARPTDENMLLLKAELRQPSFGAYHMTWTSTLSDDRLRALAEYDAKDRVTTMQEVYIDFFALDSVCFSAGVSPEISATINIPQVNWSGQETAAFARCTDSA
jgi:vacuolar protein sorting-associated protein 45